MPRTAEETTVLCKTAGKKRSKNLEFRTGERRFGMGRFEIGTKSGVSASLEEDEHRPCKSIVKDQKVPKYPRGDQDFSLSSD